MGTFFFMCIHMILFLMTAIFHSCCFQGTNSITRRGIRYTGKVTTPTSTLRVAGRAKSSSSLPPVKVKVVPSPTGEIKSLPSSDHEDDKKVILEKCKEAILVL